MNKFLSRLEKIIGSGKFAVVILSLSVVYFSVATFVESRFTSEFANAIFYKSYGMMIISILAFLSVILAMIKRLPLKKKNIGFQLIHIGILIVFIGGYFTFDAGIDGQIVLRPDYKENKIEFSDDVLDVNIDGKKSLFEFPSSAFEVSLNKNIGDIHLKTYLPFSKEDFVWRHSSKVSEIMSGRYLMLNNDTPVTEFVLTTSKQSLFGNKFHIGPIEVLLFSSKYKSTFYKDFKSFDINCYLLDGKLNRRLNDSELNGKMYPKNQVSCLSKEDITKRPSIYIFGSDVLIFDRKDNKFVELGNLNNNGINLPWMNLKLVAKETYSDKYPEMIPVSVLPTKTMKDNNKYFSSVIIESGKKSFWMKPGDSRQLVLNKRQIQIMMTKKSFNLPFYIELEGFEIEKDLNGTSPSGFKSKISVIDNNETNRFEISMNRPLKYGSFTFYQSSYFPMSENIYASILSVNYDPGRYLKYLGSILLIIGLIAHYLNNSKRKEWESLDA